MQSRGLWRLKHDISTSLRLNHTPSFPKIQVHQRKGAPICPSTAYQDAITAYIINNMDVGCSLRAFRASTMTLQQHHLVSAAVPQLSKNLTPTPGGISA